MISTARADLRSGVGSAEDVAAIGVDQTHALPGVGHNLIEHPIAYIFCVPKPGGCDLDNPLLQSMLRYTADGGEENDMQLYGVNHVVLTDMPEIHEIFGVDMPFGIAPGLQRPNSRGRLRVENDDLHAAPGIELNFFDDEQDRARMREGMRIVWDIAQHPAVAEYYERIELLDHATIDADALDQYIWDTAAQISTRSARPRWARPPIRKPWSMRTVSMACRSSTRRSCPTSSARTRTSPAS